MEAWTPDSELTAPPPVLLHTLSVQRGKRRHTATWGPSSHRTPGLTRRRQGPPSVVAWRCPSPRTPVSLRDTCRTESRATRQPCPCTGPEGTGASAGLGRKARCSCSRYLGEGRTGCGAVSPPIWGARLPALGQGAARTGTCEGKKACPHPHLPHVKTVNPEAILDIWGLRLPASFFSVFARISLHSFAGFHVG